MEQQRKIAEGLLSIRAVFFRPEEPFIWASGIKSPVYCDNRLILTAPEVRSAVESALADTIRREYRGAYDGPAYGVCPLFRKGSRPPQPD